MLSEASSHCRRARNPAPVVVAKVGNAKRLVCPSKVVAKVFPCSCRLVHLKLFRKSERFASQAAIEVTHGEMSPFGIGSAAPKEFKDFLFIAIDDA